MSAKRVRLMLAAVAAGCVVGGVTVTMPADASLPVAPVLDCVITSGTGASRLITAYFGYSDTGTDRVTFAVGDFNGVTPGEVDQGQPTLFDQGVFTKAWSTTFNPAITPALTWTLNGQDVTASAASPQCTSGITAPASDITATTATLNGVVAPDSNDTKYTFDYGTGSGYGSSTSVTGAGSGTTQVLAQSGLTGLKPDTTYYYRLDTTTSYYIGAGSGPVQVTADGQQQTFTTLSANPLVLLTTALPAGQFGAPYTVTLAVGGGTRPYTWSVSRGILPYGLRLDARTGVLSGRPLSPGSHRVAITVTDASTPAQQNLTETFTLTIS